VKGLRYKLENINVVVQHEEHGLGTSLGLDVSYDYLLSLLALPQQGS
jgi:hypothetical protein